MTMLAFSVLYTLNIVRGGEHDPPSLLCLILLTHQNEQAISNLSLDLVSVPMHQIIRAITPIFTIIISIVFLGKTYRREIYLSLIPVRRLGEEELWRGALPPTQTFLDEQIILGVGLATFGDYSATMWGFFLTLSGAFSAAVKTIATNRIQVGSLKLHPMDLLLRMSPLAFLQCMFFGYLSGEWDGVAAWNAQLQSSAPLKALWLNGILAFFLNLVSFTANKKTSALTMTVAGNIKQVLSIVLAVIIFNLTINGVNMLGIATTLGGGAWYT